MSKFDRFDGFAETLALIKVCLGAPEDFHFLLSELFSVWVYDVRQWESGNLLPLTENKKKHIERFLEALLKV